MYANTPFDCDGAQIRACSRQLATVVTVTGELDDANLDRVSQYTKRFVLREKPVVLTEIDRPDDRSDGAGCGAARRSIPAMPRREGRGSKPTCVGLDGQSACRVSRPRASFAFAPWKLCSCPPALFSASMNGKR